MRLTAAVITMNEEKNIRDCLQSISFADEIIVVDSGSTDSTRQVAELMGAKVYTEPFVHFSHQKNTALTKASGDWVFFIDADERVPAELSAEITAITKSSRMDKVFSVRRITHFFGRELRYCGTQSDYPIRLFPRDKAFFEQPVHERIVTELDTRRLAYPLIHYSTRDMEHYRQKLNQYVALELDTLALKDRKVTIFDFLLRPALKFAYIYFWNKGILDGVPGLQFAALSAFYDFKKFYQYWLLKRKKPVIHGR